MLLILEINQKIMILIHGAMMRRERGILWNYVGSAIMMKMVGKTEFGKSVIDEFADIQKDLKKSVSKSLDNYLDLDEYVKEGFGYEFIDQMKNSTQTFVENFDSVINFDNDEYLNLNNSAYENYSKWLSQFNVWNK